MFLPLLAVGILDGAKEAGLIGGADIRDAPSAGAPLQAEARDAGLVAGEADGHLDQRFAGSLRRHLHNRGVHPGSVLALADRIAVKVADFPVSKLRILRECRRQALRENAVGMVEGTVIALAVASVEPLHELLRCLGR